MISGDEGSALGFVRAYNQCFYDRDIDALRALYAQESFTVFWDNHKSCDSDDLEAHFAAVSRFFAEGKSTEAGDIEPLLIEDERVFVDGAFALVTTVLRYQSAPRPGVRSSFVLIQEDGRWKALHIHHSFDPNEAE